MKRLAPGVILFLFTFSLGVAVERMFLPRPTANAPAVIPAEPIVKFVEVPMPAPAPTPLMIADYDPTRFEPVGVFGIVGKTPRAMRELKLMSVEIFNDQIGIKVMMSTYSGSGSDYDSQLAVFGLVTPERLSFVTAPFASGFEYRFDGVLVRKRFSDGWTGVVQIKGTITKTKNGRKVAEASVTLRPYEDAC
jgi:hypothetical protein